MYKNTESKSGYEGEYSKDEGVVEKKK